MTYVINTCMPIVAASLASFIIRSGVENCHDCREPTPAEVHLCGNCAYDLSL